MKKKLCFPILIAILAILFSGKLNAQTSVNINYVGFDTSNTGFCILPTNISVYVSGITSGYTPITDSVEIYANFGDGTSSTFKQVINQNGYFWTSCPHTYTFPGQYTCEYIVTGPDGTDDTLIYQNQFIVADTCGNISGTIYKDDNSNCILDAGEQKLKNIAVQLWSAGVLRSTRWTDLQGNYSFDVPVGFTYEVKLSNSFNTIFNFVCPSTGSHTLSSFPASNTDFAITCQAGFDFDHHLSGWGFRPGFPARISAIVKNFHCQAVSGQLKVVLDPLLSFNSSTTTPTSIIGDTLIYDVNNIGMTSINWLLQTIYVTTSTSAVLGDSIEIEVFVEPTTGDLDPSNNYGLYKFPISNSWDPNMKEVYPVGRGDMKNEVPASERQYYTVHFQNTGNAEAYNIFILDTLDNNLDVSTLEIISNSHTMDFTLFDGDIMKFTFNNIMLPDSNANENESHGFVAYSIKPKSIVSNNTRIYNTAHIYFDYNPAIVTNTTERMINNTLGINETVIQKRASIYPNPVDNLLSVQIEAPYSSNVDFVIFDVRGKFIKSFKKNIVKGNQTIIINVDDFAKGFYLLNIKSADSQYNETHNFIRN